MRPSPTLLVVLVPIAWLAWPRAHAPLDARLAQPIAIGTARAALALDDLPRSRSGGARTLLLFDRSPIAIAGRDAWSDGRAPGGARYGEPIREVYTRIVVHHSDFVDPPGPLAIDDYHRQVSGFDGIGYHFVIEPDGTVYEGRPLDRMGAHAGSTVEAARGQGRQLDPDWGAIGVVLDGNYETSAPPDPQLAALVRLVAELRARFPGIRTVLGHREVRATVLARGLTPLSPQTECPGDGLFGWLVAARALGALDGPESQAPAQLEVVAKSSADSASFIGKLDVARASTAPRSAAAR